MSTYFKVSEVEKQVTKKICGLEDKTGDDQFPNCYKDFFAKHQYEKEKSQFIATAIKKFYIFDDAEVPLYPTLVKIIINRDWTASDIIKRSALVNSERGLSPFNMVDFIEEDVVLMKQDHKDLINASLVSTPEVRSTCTKII